MGPILLKQDKTEAVMGVDARLDFIKKEVSVFCASLELIYIQLMMLTSRSARIEKQINDIQEQSDSKRGQVGFVREPILVVLMILISVGIDHRDANPDATSSSWHSMSLTRPLQQLTFAKTTFVISL